MNNITTNLLLITVFKNILKDAVIHSFVEFLSELQNSSNFDLILTKYSEFISCLYENENSQNLFIYLKKLLYTDENIISKGFYLNNTDNKLMIDNAKYELSLFNELLNYNYSCVKSIFNSKFPSCSDIIEHLPVFYIENKVNFCIEDILTSYKINGYGIFAYNNAFKYTENKEISVVENFNAMTFSDLKNYDYQKDIIKRNTLALLNGKEANNILLYGDRGCGKSSTVKALINEFSDYNLKIIQVYKESFMYLSDLFDKIKNLPSKFIIFADDISFDEDDKNFSSIKAVLEGSLSEKPQNAVIYATTNRIHLVKESFSSRTGNEIHCNDTIDEIVSLSDRFGIMLTFSLLNKHEYLDIVEKIAKDYSINIDDELFRKAEEFSMLKAIRTPRVARQFIVDYISSK